MFRAITALSVLAFASVATPAAALEAEQRVLKEVTVAQADGTEKKSYVNADLVTPGDTVVYALVFRNEPVATRRGHRSRDACPRRRSSISKGPHPIVWAFLTILRMAATRLRSVQA